jgi:hypothetical protein
MKKIADKGATEAFLRANVACDHDACVIWPFGRNARGYGLAVIGGVQTLASRWMCILAHGEPPTPKHEAAHGCGNSSCVNPRHLRWDTPKGNQADRNPHGTHNRGERNGKTRLTSADVRAIRSAPPDLKALVSRYGVSKGCISKIRSGTRWMGA